MAFGVSPDGALMLCATDSQSLQMWDLPKRELVRTWRAHKFPVVLIEWDVTSTLVATASSDRSTIVWDARGGFATHALPSMPGVPSMLRFARYSSSDANAIELWTGSSTGDYSLRVSDLGNSRSSQAQKMGSRAASSQGASKRSSFRRLDGHHASAVDIAFDGVASRAYSVAATVGRDQVLHLWDPKQSLKPIATRPLFEHPEAVVSLGTYTERELRGSAAGGAAKSRRAKRGRAAGEMPDSDPAVSAGWTSWWLATAGDSGRIRLWSIERSGAVSKPLVIQERASVSLATMLQRPSEWILHGELSAMATASESQRAGTASDSPAILSEQVACMRNFRRSPGSIGSSDSMAWPSVLVATRDHFIAQIDFNIPERVATPSGAGAAMGGSASSHTGSTRSACMRVPRVVVGHSDEVLSIAWINRSGPRWAPDAKMV